MKEKIRVKIAICDDRKEEADSILDYIRTYAQQRQIEVQENVFGSGDRYKEMWERSEEPDILLLDVEMPKLCGIQLKEYLQENRSKTKILFITSHNEAMGEAFGANVYGFLVKPVEKELLFEYLDKMCRTLKKEKMIFQIDETTGEIVRAENILWIQSEKQYSWIQLEDDKKFSNKSLAQWEEELLGQDFCRVHKSYIANFRHINQIADEIKMDNGAAIPIARRRKGMVKDEFKNFLIREVQ